MNDSPPKPGGVFASLRRILDGGLLIAQNRVELFAVELREEKCRLVEAILLASAVVALGIMTLTLVTVLVIILLWESALMAALITLSLLYLLGTILVWRSLRAKLARPTAFTGTLAELKKDQACLQTENSRG